MEGNNNMASYRLQGELSKKLHCRCKSYLINDD